MTLPRLPAAACARLLRCAVVAAVIASLAVLIAAGALDTFGRLQRASGSYDVIVVAGCRVLEGGIPSVALERRVALAVRHWKDGRAPRIILTGGVGSFPPAEAEAAATVARRLGVPASALVLESRSTSTAENARFARRLTNAKRVLLVTDSYHVYRARWVFRQYFASVDAVGSLAPPTTRIAGALREVAAVVYHRVRGLLSGQ